MGADTHADPISLSLRAGLDPHRAVLDEAGAVRSVIEASPPGPHELDSTSFPALPAPGLPGGRSWPGSGPSNTVAPGPALAGAARSLIHSHHGTDPISISHAQRPLQGASDRAPEEIFIYFVTTRHFCRN